MTGEPIKVGDELAFFDRGEYRIHTAERITPSGRIRCGPWELNPDLTVRGRGVLDPSHAEQVTPEIRARVHRQRLLRKLAHVYWPDMPDAVLERVHRIVEDEYRGQARSGGHDT